MKKINSHFHVNFQHFTVDDIVKYMYESNTEKIWLLTWEEDAPPIEGLYEHLSVNDILEAIAKYPERFVPFYAPDPKSENPEDIFNKYVSLGIKGCGELKVTNKWEDDTIERYLQVLSKYNMPLLFHMEEPREQYVKPEDNLFENLLEQLLNGAMNGVTRYYLTKLAKNIPPFYKKIKKNYKYFPGYLYDFNYLEKRINQFPNIIFIGHGPHFWNNISSYLSPKYVHQKGKIKSFGIIDKLLETYDNFYCDISGKSGFNALTRDKKMSKLFLEKHHEKLLFGTDNTPYDFEGLLQSFNLPKNKLENIYFKNAEKIIKE